MQGFCINRELLKFIRKNRPTLEKMGLLMPSILVHANPIKAFDLMRSLYSKNDEMKKCTSLDALLMQLSIKIQNARNED